MELVDEVQAVLTEAFPPPAKVELTDTGRIFGAVVSSRFEGMESYHRLKMIWDVLDEKLPREKHRRVVMIVAATPEEEIAYSA